jgi:hypothetical protein
VRGRVLESLLTEKTMAAVLQTDELGAVAVAVHCLHGGARKETLR